MSKIKVGDRVEFISVWDGNIPYQSKGTVVDVRQGICLLIEVLFDEPHCGRRTWTTAEEELMVLPVSKSPSIADEVNLQPLPKKILHYMRTRGAISPLVAFSTYGTMRLAAAINELRRAGYDIVTTIKTDEEGDKYASYHLNEAKAA